MNLCKRAHHAYRGLHTTLDIVEEAAASGADSDLAETASLKKVVLRMRACDPDEIESQKAIEGWMDG